METLIRTSNNINIANFWENQSLNKYNFDPSYQRKSDVWSDQKKSFLIDTILKNFPIPPIFLHQHIDPSSGKTLYDIIDGKQRLSSIVEFINNGISIPDDFHSDGFGDEKLSGKFFKDLEKEIEIKKAFWRYEITIEYVDTNRTDVVDNIFDRLNRNGAPLTRQELRHAKHHSSCLYQTIVRLAKSKVLEPVFTKINSNRLEDHEFVSELLFMQIHDTVLAGDQPETLDQTYEEYIKPEYDATFFQKHENDFHEIEAIIQNFNIDFEKHRVFGISHVYGLWGLAWRMWLDNLKPNNIESCLNGFYEKYRNADTSEFVHEYKETMSSNTKSRNRRDRRINALINYCQSQQVF